MTIRHHFIATPVGRMRAELDDGALRALFFWEEREQEGRAEGTPPPLAGQISRQIEQWYAGLRVGFDLPLASVGTPFQRAVWAAVSEVPPGSVVTYTALAERLGRPGAARAVGTALGRNPFLLIVPCHRVIASDGSLGGYAGGLGRKRMLIALERESLHRAGALA